MKRINTKVPIPIGCKYCGSLPETQSVDVHFKKDDTLITTQHEIRCSNQDCDKKYREHRHFTPKATRREAIMAWNRINRRKVAE